MSEILMIFLTALSGFFASIVGAFSGGGASLIAFPLIWSITGATYGSVLALTKLSALGLVVVSGGIHAYRQDIRARLFGVLVVFGAIGTAFGTYLVQYQFQETVFKVLLGVTLLVAAVYLFFSKKLGAEEGKDRAETVHNLLITAGFAMAINVLNGLFGGTGIFVSLFLVLFWRMTFIRAIAYTMASYIVINVMQTSYLLLTEEVDMVLAVALFAGSMFGSYMGTHLQYLKGNRWVKLAATLVMLVIGVQVLISLA